VELQQDPGEEEAVEGGSERGGPRGEDAVEGSKPMQVLLWVSDTEGR
jgi:hypothetical protein